MRAHEPAQTVKSERPPLYIVRPPQPHTLTVAVLNWPLAAPTLRPGLRLDELLWRPRQRLPDWLRGYLLVELPLPTSAIPTVPSPFRNGLATIPSCLALQGVLAGVHNAHPGVRGWERSDLSRPIFSHRKPGGTITTSVHLLQSSDVSDRTLASLWGVVSDLTDLDGDVLLAALAHALDAADADGTTWITADAILDDRGIRPKMERAGTLRYRAGHRREDRARVAASMDRLEHLWVHLQDVAWLEPRHDRRPRRSHLTHESKLLVIVDRLVHDGLPVAWRYRPGAWLTPFLSRPNRQTALLAQQVLRYDPYRERWEKRLGRYLTFHLRMDARRAAPLVRRIGPVLAELNLPIDRRHPERTRARFEAALNRLVEDGVIGAWEYAAESQAVLASLPARRWVEQWQALTVVVRTSPTIAAHYAAIVVAPRVPRA